MKRLILVTAALLVGVACNQNQPQKVYRSALTPPTSLTLTNSNTEEFNGQVSIPVEQVIVNGNTEVRIGPVASWPILNGFLGFDKFYYSASKIDHPVIAVRDEGCVEAVVDGEACGWKVNYDGSTADGFGTFASSTTAEGASHGGKSMVLVFVLQGDAPINANDHGARFALHGRFDQFNGYSPGCSGWFSDGRSTDIVSDSGCLYAANCRIVVSPSSASLFAGESTLFDVQTYVSGIHALELTLAIGPTPLPVGLSATLTPNPVQSPSESILRIATTELLAAGTYPFNVSAVGEAYGLPVRCETRISLDISKRPPPPPSGDYCVCE